jgi:hypothetical protein
MTDRRVIERNAGRAEHVAAVTRDVERGPNVVPLRERNLEPASPDWR